MKKIKIISLVLAAVTLLGCLSACGKTGADKDSDNPSTQESFVEYDPAFTNYWLVQNGQSDYTIVVPVEDGEVTLTKHSSELNYFIEGCTGNTLSVVGDDKVSYGASSKIISLGNTTAAKAAGLPEKQEDLGESGYSLKTIGQSIFIQGNTSTAVLNGIYDFLKYQFGAKTYSYDEIKMPKAENLYLKAFDYKGIPSFDTRALDLAWDNPNTFNYTYEERMKVQPTSTGWITIYHTHFKIMPPSEYLEEHRDWYSADKGALCLTNEGMIAQMIENIKQMVSEYDLSYRNEYYFMIGQEDIKTFCECENCAPMIEKYGNEAGLMMVFINKLADALNPWAKENYPDKKIYWVTFAYQRTVVPPVKMVNGKYEPYHPDVVAHENVGIEFAPLGSDFYHSFTDRKYNDKTVTGLQGWDIIGGKKFIYTYSSVYDNAFFMVDDYGILAEQYKQYVDMDAIYIFNESAHINAEPFHAMSYFVRANLMWNVNYSVNDLIDEFMTEYYKDSAPYVRQYFNALRYNYKRLDEEYEAKGEIFKLGMYLRTTDYDSEEFYPRSFLESCITILDKAIEEAKKIQDSAISEKVRIRVQREKMSMIHHLILLYNDEMTQVELKNLIADFETYALEGGVTKYHGYTNNTITYLVNTWKRMLDSE